MHQIFEMLDPTQQVAILQAENRELKAKCKILEQENATLRQRVEELEHQVAPKKQAAFPQFKKIIPPGAGG